MGATPMIGQNDVPGETLLAERRAGLVAFAHRCTLRRVSMWSANRDSQCGAQVLDRAGLEHLQRRQAEAARVHLGARTAQRPPAGPRDAPRPRPDRAAPADPRRSGNQPVPDLARVEGLQGRRRDRLAPARLRGQVVHAGRLPRRSGRTPLGHAVALHRPDPRERRAASAATGATHARARGTSIRSTSAGNTGAAQRPASTRRSGGRRPTSRRPIRSDLGNLPWQVVGKADGRAARRQRRRARAASAARD